MCSMAAASGGEVDVIELGGGVNIDSSGVKRTIVLGKISMSCVVPATTESGEEPGLRGFLMAVLCAGQNDVETDMVLFSRGTSTRFSSTWRGVSIDEDVAWGVQTTEAESGAALLCRTAGAKIGETESS